MRNFNSNPLKLSEERKNRIAEGLKRSYAEGRRKKGHSLETRKKMSELKKIAYREGRIKPVFLGQKRLDLTGEKNVNWKGNKVGYDALHDWVNRVLGKAGYCENNIDHTSTRYHWANVSGEYNRDLKDWRQVCPSCNLTDGIRKAERFMKGGLLEHF